MVQSSGELSYVWFGFISISLFFTFSWRVETKEARKSKDDPVPGKCLVGDKPTSSSSKCVQLQRQACIQEQL